MESASAALFRERQAQITATLDDCILLVSDKVLISWPKNVNLSLRKLHLLRDAIQPGWLNAQIIACKQMKCNFFRGYLLLIMFFGVKQMQSSR